MSRILAIGDIHGCLNKLEALMSTINWRPEEDILVFIGDYVDRGPDSAGVIEYILGLKKQSERIICLMGNHEALFLDFIEGKNEELFISAGGRPTISSYGGTDKGVPRSHFEFLKSLVYYYETEDYIFVHAGLRDGIPLAEQDREDLLWIRSEFLWSDYNHDKRIVFGHTPFRRPLIQTNKIGIDTGAVYDGRLTCVELPRARFYSV